MEPSVSGVGVLDKAVTILDALELGSRSLAELVDVTGISRATAHRLALALEVHGLVERDEEGRFTLGPRMAGNSLVQAARPALEWLRDETGESVQLYVRRGDVRICVVSLESPHSLRTIVPVGATLPMDRGSAAKVLQAGGRDLAESVEEREKGVASVSAAVHDGEGRHIAAVSVSGPVERTSRAPGKRYADALLSAAKRVEQAARW
ncbi:MAG: IclR family transcriptional regulator [Actinobacteria bacterium]|nr:IclR family transcriptional regulator [Actinomycetota bacterium]MBV8958803.1 IclR family transcriptional regulator [Actinomycetota bacterium]MBV9665780.1 IclR family transcriptional regulator [Actinomycetota bacterium]MBV9933730.1 IclR family transcriptional regulator [Actinomycetota bacterium]